MLESGGAKAVTHRAVSEAAGLPAAAAGYYFPAVSDLATAAISFHVEQRLDQLRAVASAARSEPPKPPLDLARETGDRLAQGEAYVAIGDYEVLLEAARNPAFRPIAAAARRELEQAFIRYFSGIGVAHVVPAARLHLALVDGFALQQLAFGDLGVHPPTAADTFVALFEHFRADDAERARRRAALAEPLPQPFQPPSPLPRSEHAGLLAAAGGRGASQQRSRERREQLLSAAIALFETGGSKVITHRAVSQVAKLPPATAGYYFPQIEELLREAVQFHVRGRLNGIVAMLTEAGAEVGSRLDLLDVTARRLAEGGTGVGTTHFELFLEAARNPSFRPIALAARRDFETVLTDYFGQLGVPDVLRLAQVYLVLADGLALQRLAFGSNVEAETSAMAEASIAIVGFHLATDAERNRLRESLTSQLPAR